MLAPNINALCVCPQCVPIHAIIRVRPYSVDVCYYSISVGFQYPLAELSAEDRVTICIIESYLDFKVTNFTMIEL